MDRKAGYKECSRCGLRNKPSALQCDFCGLRFIAGEDWDDNIQALEKMGGNEERVLVDEDVSKRIAATIVKRDKFNAPVKAKETGSDDFDYFRKEPETTRNVPARAPAPQVRVARAKAFEARVDRPATAAQTPVQAPPAMEKIVMPEPATAAAEPEPAMEQKQVRRVVRPSKPVFTAAKTSTRTSTFAAVLLLGVVWYLVAILFGDGTFGRIGSWALITVSTLMVVVGAGGMFKGRPNDQAGLEEHVSKDEPTKEVMICPKCHELIKSTDRTCPDCGAEFRSE